MKEYSQRKKLSSFSSNIISKKELEVEKEKKLEENEYYLRSKIKSSGLAYLLFFLFTSNLAYLNRKSEQFFLAVLYSGFLCAFVLDAFAFYVGLGAIYLFIKVSVFISIEKDVDEYNQHYIDKLGDLKND